MANTMTTPEISKALRAAVQFLDYADELFGLIAEQEGRELELGRGAQLDLEALATWFESNPRVAQEIDEQVLKHWYIEELDKRELD